MRLHLKIQTNNEIIPFDHQHYLTGAVHKWLGKNNEHGDVSLFSFSWLQGGKKTTTGLHFGKQTALFFSSYDIVLIKKLIRGIQSDNRIYNGFTVEEMVIQEDPDFSNQTYFQLASPILIKRKIEQNIQHITYKNASANLYLKETLATRMEKAGIAGEDFEISFNPSNGNASTKLVKYKSIENRANWCPITIYGSNTIKQFAWNVGIGNSTGIGFGAIK